MIKDASTSPVKIHSIGNSDASPSQTAAANLAAAAVKRNRKNTKRLTLALKNSNVVM